MNHLPTYRDIERLLPTEQPALDAAYGARHAAANTAQRERIATAALVGLLSATAPAPGQASASPTAEHMAARAVRHADALIDALTRRG